MAVRISCPCGSTYQVKAELAGKRIKCPACAQPITVPQPAMSSRLIRVKCSCGQALGAKGESAGKRIKCPSCQQILTVPQPKEARSSIQTVCHCGKALQVKAELSGRRLKCPACGGTVSVPGGAAKTTDARSQSDTDNSNPDPLGLVGIASEFPLSDNDFGGRSLKPTREPSPIASPAYAAAASFNPTKTGQAASERVSNLEPRQFLFVGAGVTALMVAVAGLLLPSLGLLVGGAISLLAILPGVVGALWILILAFDEDLLCGVLYLFLPFYSLYYVVTRWENAPPFWLLGGSIAAQFGVNAYLFLLSTIW